MPYSFMSCQGKKSCLAQQASLRMASHQGTRKDFSLTLQKLHLKPPSDFATSGIGPTHQHLRQMFSVLHCKESFYVQTCRGVRPRYLKRICAWSTEFRCG